MEESPLAHNRARSSLAEEVLSHVDVQDRLAALINKLGSVTAHCWWKLLDDEPNGLC